MQRCGSHQSVLCSPQLPKKNRTRQGVPADGFALPELSVTTLVMLYLLRRWTHTLKDHQRQCAESILRHLIGLIPSTALQWHFTEQDALEHAFPCTTSEDSVVIDVSAQECGIVQLCTLSRALASAFKAHGHKLETTWNNAPAEQRVKLWRLALWLTGGSGKRTYIAAHSLLSWLSWLLEHSSLWEQASSDALLHAPAPQGVTRSRRIDPVLRQALGRASAEGLAGRSGSHLVKVMARFRRWGKPRVHRGQVATARDERVHCYRQLGLTTFTRERANVLCIACDGARMGKWDTLYAALWAPQLQVGMPQTCICHCGRLQNL